ncbi:hypothetical protein AVEN_146010-1 [Araneus ventricosus]|uniref:CCHC-type domain-containing protein n=1 Tax=Araneus ventricosus TaxID=182803 RepID=A0A4Y2UUM2_ARAVE|nr:hypothetical protein AVEN_146010-1 [Araneus ventricosus]
MSRAGGCLPLLGSLVGGAVGTRTTLKTCMGRKKHFPFSGHQMDVNINENHYDKFFLVKRISSQEETFNSVSPFLVQRSITENIGDVSSVRKLRSGDLLIEVNSRTQAQKIVKIKTFGSIPVSVSSHVSMNSSKGVISCGELLNDTTEEITKELKSQGVTHVRRISVRRVGQLFDTKHLVLTFNSPKLPQSIKAGYMKLVVKPYIPNPLRCFRCQRFGHSKVSCRGTLTCGRCAEQGHDSQQCTSEEKCANCKGKHASYSRSCTIWQFEKEVIAVKVKQQVSYLEAKKIVKGRTPLPGNSYVSKLKNTVYPKRNQTLPTDTSLDSVQITPSTAPIQEQDPIPICKVSDSHDVSGFTIVKKKKAKQRSTSLKDAENKPNSVVASKFWRTSPLENSTPTSVRSSYSRKSIIKANGATVNDHDKLASTVNSGPEPMAIDNKLLDSPKTDIEPDTVIEYNPNETIDEIPPVLEQQPSTSSTTTDKSTLKQRFKKWPLRWVDIDFKTFYNEPLSTPVHDKYLKKHQIKRLQLASILSSSHC